MAGMAWTLHPALFYEKYGTVLVQLWDSGALGTLFWPLRRLSKSIGDAVAAGLSQLPRLTDSKADAEDSKALLIDDSEVTEDEACTRVNRELGDTSPDPSTSEENELAFQGDLYTRLRRSRRQKERIKKIRASREQILGDDSTSSTSDTGRRKKRRRRRSHPAPMGNRALRKEFGQIGTPLTDMSGAAPRGVVLDVSDTSSLSTPSKDETGGDVGVGGVRKITPSELLADNDRLKMFRAASGTAKRAPASPPPELQQPSSGTPSSVTPSETASVAIDAAGGPVTGVATPTCAQVVIPPVISPFIETEANKIADLPALGNSPTSPSTETPDLPFSRVPGQMSLSSPENIGSKSDDPKFADDDATIAYRVNEESPFEFTHDLADECAMEDWGNKLRLEAQACPESEEMSHPTEYGIELSPALPDNSKEEGRPSLQGSELPADKIYARPKAGVGAEGSVDEHCSGTLTSAACNEHEEAGEGHAGAEVPKEICSKSGHKIPHKPKKHHHKKRHHKMHIAEKPETVPQVKPPGPAQVVPHEDMSPSETADNADSAILDAAPKRHHHSKKHKKHAKHGRRRSSTVKKKEEGKKAASAQATSTGPTTSGDFPSGQIAEGTADHPEKALDGVKGASRVIRLLPSMDTTGSESTHSSHRDSDLEHHTHNAALIEGKNVTVHLDVSSAHKKPMFWPFVTKKHAK